MSLSIPVVQKRDFLFQNDTHPFARGGQGLLFKVSATRKLSNQVVTGREYLLKTPRRLSAIQDPSTELKRLDALFLRLAKARGHLLSRVATPLAAVRTDESEYIGFLMKEFSDGCYFKKSYSSGESEPVLNELKNHLIPFKERQRLSVPELDELTRLRLVADLFHTLSLIHETGLIVGDMSSSNLIVQQKPGSRNQNRIILLDVDSFLLENESEAKHSPTTLNWRSPEEEEGTLSASRKSDVYKAALASIRLLHQSMVLHDDTSDLFNSEEASLVLEHLGGQVLSRRFQDALSEEPPQRPAAQEISFLLATALENQSGRTNQSD